MKCTDNVRTLVSMYDDDVPLKAKSKTKINRIAQSSTVEPQYM
jgi:hypothetical protein